MACRWPRPVCCLNLHPKVISKNQPPKGGFLLSSFLEVDRVSLAELVPSPGDVFYDRSLLDTLSYLQAGSKPTPEWMDLAPYPYHYKVFIFPPWEAIYRTDGERWEPFETAVQVHESLVSTYSALGYELIEVPRASVEQRVEFILHVLGRK